MEIITKLRIPYDVDALFDGGCGGSDLWSDDYGEGVTVMISDTGSAYVCPDDPKGDWRIYVADGMASRLEGAFDGETGFEIEDASGDIAEILACALSSGSDPSGAFAVLINDPSEPALTWDAVEGVTMREPGLWGWIMSIFRTPFSFEDGRFSYANLDEGFDVDRTGIARGWWIDCNAWDEYGPACKGPYNYFGVGSESIESAEAFIGKRMDSAAGIERIALEFASRLIERSVTRTAEIKKFEKACGKAS